MGLRVLTGLVLLAAALMGQPKDLELFLLIGQSNMAGRGVVEPQDREPVANVWTLDKELAWTPAVDPLHFDKPDIVGVGIGRSFARRLLQEKPNAAIGLIPCAFGGTSLNEWSPDGRLFQDAVRRTKAALQSGHLRGILWHQGEADSGDEKLASTYRERFATMIAALRNELGATGTPVIAGGLGEFLPQSFFRWVGVEADN